MRIQQMMVSTSLAGQGRPCQGWAERQNGGKGKQLAFRAGKWSLGTKAAALCLSLFRLIAAQTYP